MHKHWLGRSLFGVLVAGLCWQAENPLHANDKMTLHLAYTSDTIGYVDACG